jgi:4-aminobutyrate aminotransferase/(S)-3-amino-2-methylpropionate transaminase
MIVEPVLGEGGFVVPPSGYLAALADLCRRYGIILIADEVQTGFGRTGRLFACEHDGVEPDLLVMAKSLAGGLPLAAVVGRAEIMDHPGPGSLGSTYGGNPAACAAALAVLNRLESGELLKRSEDIGARIEAEARRWRTSCALVGDVRRLGAMVGIELVCDRSSREPAPEAAAHLVRRACEHGVILLTAGTYGNVFRFLTPLTITDAELDEGLAVLTECVGELR